MRNGWRRNKLSIAIVAGLLSASMAGCVDRPPLLPPTFRYDAIRYSYEGDHLIVNVTFTNVANYSGHASGFSPYISVSLHAERTVRSKGQPGRETEYVPDEHASIWLYFENRTGVPGDEWKGRWNRSGSTGPIAIMPGTRVQVEFDLQPITRFRADEGHYYLLFEMPSFEPFPDREAEDSDYHTGCFNPDTSEFYGVHDDGPDCRVWDCTGEDTRYGYAVLRDVKDSYKPKCDATNATGPQYVH